jgi:hypothetical protein
VYGGPIDGTKYSSCMKVTLNPFTIITHVSCNHTLLKVVLSFEKIVCSTLKGDLITLTSETGMAAILV